MFFVLLAVGCYSKLVGLSSAVQLIEIDPKTAATTPIGPAFGKYGELQAQELSAVDSVRDLVYFIGFNMSAAQKVPALIALSGSTGKIKFQCPLPFVEEAFVGVGQTIDVDATTGSVYATGRAAKDQLKHEVMMFKQPETCDGESVAVIGDMDMLGGFHAFDPVDQALWLNFGVNHSGVIQDVMVKVKKGQVNTFQNPDLLQTLSFDSHKKRMVGIGLDMSDEAHPLRTILSLSPEGKTKRLTTIPGYFVISAGESALDAKNGVMFAYLQPHSANGTAPMHLVGVDVDGGIVSQPYACANVATCPWSLEWL